MGDAGKGKKRLAPKRRRHRALGAGSQADDGEPPAAAAGTACVPAAGVGADAGARATTCGGAGRKLLFLNCRGCWGGGGAVFEPGLSQTRRQRERVGEEVREEASSRPLGVMPLTSLDHAKGTREEERGGGVHREP